MKIIFPRDRDRDRDRDRRAFTLIELLVVIAIIAILMGLLIPSVSGVIENAKRAQAKNDVTQIATAVIAYETEYGKLPAAATTVNDTLLKTLAGQDDTTNPRGIVFLEVPNAKGGKNGVAGSGGTISGDYMDSWKQAYKIDIDTDYDNQVTGDDITIRKRVAVWSDGNPDKGDKPVYSWE